MRINDVHAHLLDEPNHLENLLAAMDECGIERCCLIGLGPLFACKGNDKVKRRLKTTRTGSSVPFFVRPGLDSPELIDRAYEDDLRKEEQDENA